MEKVKPYTKSDFTRMLSMARAIEAVERDGIPGAVVEVGVWRGGNIMLATLMAPERTCWMYDTFDGMTEPDAMLDVKRDGERAIDRWMQKQAGGTKWDAVSLDDVQQGFLAEGIDISRVHFVSGPVETTLDMISPKVIAILRLDVDWHRPTKHALEKLYGRMSQGGFLIVDDYGHWMGAKKAVDDFFGKFFPEHFDADYSCRVFRK